MRIQNNQFAKNKPRPDLLPPTLQGKSNSSLLRICRHLCATIRTIESIPLYMQKLTSLTPRLFLLDISSLINTGISKHLSRNRAIYNNRNKFSIPTGFLVFFSSSCLSIFHVLFSTIPVHCLFLPVPTYQLTE